MPRQQATKDDVRAISAEHDAAAPRAAAPAPASTAAAAILAAGCFGRPDRGAADRLDGAVVLRRLDRQRGIGRLDQSRGRAWPRLRLRLAIDRRLPVRHRHPLRQGRRRVQEQSSALRRQRQQFHFFGASVSPHLAERRDQRAGYARRSGSGFQPSRGRQVGG